MRREVPGRAFLWTCRSCGNTQREDEGPHEEDCWGCCTRRYYLCNNVDCRDGLAARELRDHLRRERCERCGGTGFFFDDEGYEMICDVEECRAGGLMARDVIAGIRYAPSGWDALGD